MKTVTRNIVSGLVAIVLAIVAWQAAQAGRYKAIRDVHVSCTNGLTCRLWLYPPQAHGFSGVALERPGAPNASVSLLVGVPPLAAGSSVTFEVDGRQVLAVAAASLTYNGDEGRYRLSDDKAVETLIAAFRSGDRLVVGYRDDKGGHRVTLSLSGFVAGLIFIDETQARLKHTDALQAKGDLPPAKEAAARDITAFDQIPASIRPQFADDNAVCGGIEPSRFSMMDGFEASAGEGTQLYGLPCGLGGAYNQPFVFYEQTDAGVRQLALPVMGDGGPTTTWTAWNISWNQVDGSLTAFFKGRGLGDCGNYDKWVLKDGGEGAAFVLEESRSKGDCDGNYMGGPQHWPLEWPLK